jgi:predicted enzyme related to lactoylglutathione lyase
MKMKLKSVSALTMISAAVALVIFQIGVNGPLASASDQRAAEGYQAKYIEQAASRKEPKAMSEFQGLRTVVYRTSDLAKAKAWYSQVLGKQPYFDQPFYVGFNVEGYELGLVPDEKAATQRDSTGIAYWGVADAKATYDRLLKMGATAHEPIQDVGEGIIVGAVTDPFGNIFGVIYNPKFKLE